MANGGCLWLIRGGTQESGSKRVVLRIGLVLVESTLWTFLLVRCEMRSSQLPCSCGDLRGFFSRNDGNWL